MPGRASREPGFWGPLAVGTVRRSLARLPPVAGGPAAPAEAQRLSLRLLSAIPADRALLHGPPLPEPRVPGMRWGQRVPGL